MFILEKAAILLPKEEGMTTTLGGA